MRKILTILALLTFTLGNAQELEGGHYKGFLDAKFGLNKIKQEKGLKEMSIGVNTSHGYQITSWVYTGAGLGVHYYSMDPDGAGNRNGIVGLPIFANLRFNAPTGTVSPFFDAKIGYSPTKRVRGLYFSPSIGIRMGVDHMAANLTIGYTLQKYKVGEFWNFVYTPGNIIVTDHEKVRNRIDGLYISLGFDF